MTAPRSLLVGLAVAAAAVMIAVLIHLSGVDLQAFVRVITTAPLWVLATILIATGVHILLGAVKWRMVMRRLAPDAPAPGFGYFVFYTALAAVSTQLLPPYVAGAGVRGVATRVHGQGSFIRGAAGSGIEQLFDVYVVLLIGVPVVVVMLAGAGPLLLVSALAAAAMAGKLALDALVVHPAWRGVLERRLAAFRLKPLQKLGRVMQRGDAAGLFRSRLVNGLYALSLLRFAALAARPLAVAWVIDAPHEAQTIFHGFAAVQLSRFIAFTPGNLGIAEWGWTAVLAASGWEFETATVFALAVRVLSLAALFVVFVGAGLAFLRARRPEGDRA